MKLYNKGRRYGGVAGFCELIFMQSRSTSLFCFLKQIHQFSDMSPLCKGIASPDISFYLGSFKLYQYHWKDHLIPEILNFVLQQLLWKRIIIRLILLTATSVITKSSQMPRNTYLSSLLKLLGLTDFMLILLCSFQRLSETYK